MQRKSDWRGRWTRLVSDVEGYLHVWMVCLYGDRDRKGLITNSLVKNIAMLRKLNKTTQLNKTAAFCEIHIWENNISNFNELEKFKFNFSKIFENSKVIINISSNFFNFQPLWVNCAAFSSIMLTFTSLAIQISSFHNIFHLLFWSTSDTFPILGSSEVNLKL